MGNIIPHAEQSLIESQLVSILYMYTYNLQLICIRRIIFKTKNMMQCERSIFHYAFFPVTIMHNFIQIRFTCYRLSCN